MLLLGVLIAGAAIVRASASSGPPQSPARDSFIGDGFGPGTEPLNSANSAPGALSPADLAELNSLALQAQAEATTQDGNGSATEADSGSTTSNGTTGTSSSGYVNINEKGTNYLLATSEDGNFGLVDNNILAGINFVDSGSGTTMLDDKERIMHYYPDTIAAFGVSRFRVADETSFPKRANIISLTPLNVAGVKNMYVAIDTIGNVFFPTICFLEGAAPKIFLVKDPVAGIQALETNHDLRYTVTGAAVQNCSAIVFTLNEPASSR